LATEKPTTTTTTTTTATATSTTIKMSQIVCRRSHDFTVPYLKNLTECI
jgi:hypothetical protein